MLDQKAEEKKFIRKKTIQMSLKKLIEKKSVKSDHRNIRRTGADLRHSGVRVSLAC